MTRGREKSNTHKPLGHERSLKKGLAKDANTQRNTGIGIAGTRKSVLLNAVL